MVADSHEEANNTGRCHPEIHECSGNANRGTMRLSATKSHINNASNPTETMNPEAIKL